MSQLNVNAIRSANGTGDAISLTAASNTCTANITNYPHRNLIINGAFQLAQRSSSSTSNGYKTVDRFSHYSGGGTTTWSVGTETSGTVWEKGLRKYFRCTNTANATAAGNYREITYKIENQDLIDSGWNPASTSSKLTLSFWVRASVAQVYYGRIRWMGDSADSNFVFSTGSLTADTWTKVTVSIPGKSGKTLNDGGGSADNSSIFQLNWAPFQGTDGTASGVALNTWNTYSGSDKYPDFTTTWGSTNGATFDLTGIQLEVSDYATDFENRSIAQELILCERYYEKSYDVGTAPGTADRWGGAYQARDGTASTTIRYYPVQYRTTKRTSSITTVFYRPDSGDVGVKIDSNANGALHSGVGDKGFMAYSNDTGGSLSHYGIFFQWTAECEL